MVYPKEPAKIRWGELEEDVGEDLDFLLPPCQVIGPDENGIKRAIEYEFDEDGNMVKITTITRTRKLANMRISKRAIERRNLPKFGDAVHEDSSSHLTMVSTEEILLERPKPIGISLTADASGSTNGVYVPRCMRGSATADRIVESGMRRRNDENSVRVNNLSEDTREPDLYELFRPFGCVRRVYVAIDQKSGTSRGFGFVNFVSREDAGRAINKLNGYGYDNLILRVEWATPRTT
ncbi:uncharacterized protein LOC131616658 [Vicia villosa]|uniref:uncharacterized protein LOC131616658 n=1 Tax=Vicia villosa TaxID=3911 RepID=UPI00273BE824|nr:uncharacterized protein LOC131616658 [Vicia villosa]